MLRPVVGTALRGGETIISKNIALKQWRLEETMGKQTGDSQVGTPKRVGLSGSLVKHRHYTR